MGKRAKDRLLSWKMKYCAESEQRDGIAQDINGPVMDQGKLPATSDAILDLHDKA
jgi:hypothetical protein